MKLAILTVAAIAGITLCAESTAECYVKSNIKLTRQSINAGPTDLQKLVTPGHCSVQYRVHIGDNWMTAEGSGAGKTEAEACGQAMDISRARILLEASPKTVSASTQLVCSDLPEIQIRKVHTGEIIWESEVDMHRHPDERKYFVYKGTQCRMFTERDSKDRNFYTYQGIICRTNSNSNSKWQVVDKY
jgi:hypothetical protein